MANYVRVILFSNENGSKEGVIFTLDFEAPTTEFIPSGFQLSSESQDVKEYDLPNRFPFDYILWRD